MAESSNKPWQPFFSSLRPRGERTAQHPGFRADQLARTHSLPTDIPSRMRWLFLAQPGTNSRSILRDIMRGFTHAGHDALTLELAQLWDAQRRNPADKPSLMSEAAAHLVRFIKRERIDATFAMWANGLTTYMHGLKHGQPATVFDLLDIPHVCYWLDAPHWAHSGAIRPSFRHPLIAGGMLTHIINNQATADEMTRVLGFGRTIALPYAINPEIFHPIEGVTPDFDLIASCGPGDPKPSEAALAQLDAVQPDFEIVRRDQAQRLRTKLAPLAEQTSHPTHTRALLDRLLDSQLADRHTPILTRLDAIAQADAALAPAVRELLDAPALFVDLTMGVRRVENLERAFTITHLARRFRVAVFGRNDLAPWRCPATMLGEIPYDSMPHAYARARVALNAMRWQDDAGLNLKPYEITASGLPCLSIRRTGLERSFTPDEEIVPYDSPTDAERRLRELLDNPARRDCIAVAGHNRTHADHQWPQRVESITTAMSNRTRIAA